MNLSDTISGMCSIDYNERFVAEYRQLEIRAKRLSNMLEKWTKGELNFTPKCSYELLFSQLVAMAEYARHLEERAKIEGINLD